MALFLSLLVGHLLGDFVFQPGRLVLAKRESPVWVLLHTGLVGAFTLTAVIGQGSIALLAAAAATASHGAIELVTVWMRNHTPARGVFLLVFDQVLHVGAVALVVSSLVGWRFDGATSAFGVATDVGTLAALVALLFVAAFGSILVFELTHLVAPPRPGEVAILGFGLQRLAGYVERAGALLVGLASPALMVVPFVPRAIYALTVQGEYRTKELVTIAAGLGLCALGWMLVAGVVATIP